MVCNDCKQSGAIKHHKKYANGNFLCCAKTPLIQGVLPSSPVSLVSMQAVERQAAAGVAEADSLLLVVDGQEGLTASDQEIVTWLRRKHPKKPVTLAVNKCENVRVADTQV